VGALPDRDEPQAIGPPGWLIDHDTGVVWLRLVPFHLERLHGPYPAEAPRGDAARLAGLPFPLKLDARPLDVHLHHGMSEAAAGLGEDRQWHAYALTPFGWVSFPTPEFRRGRLVALALQPHVTRSTLETYATAATWLRGELGSPHRRKGRPPIVHRNEDPLHWKSLPGRMEWTFRWGAVRLGFDVRDNETELAIHWGRPKSLLEILKKRP
jgi:hypothetical protein